MKYDSTGLRRPEKALKEEDAKMLLENAEYGVLSIRSEKNGAYGIGMNYAWDGEDTIYFHGANEGHKYDLLKACNKVSFCVIGNTARVERRFTMSFDDVIANGIIEDVKDPDEIHKALRMMLEKYCPNNLEKSVPYEQKMAPHTRVFKMTITSACGKRSI